jgi:phosphoserine phosphatase RsbU/P
MKKSAISEIEYILSYYCRLFKCKKILLFPSVSGNTIKPIIAIQSDTEKIYKNASEIRWINYYQEVLTKNTMPDNSGLHSFLKYYNLDIILPIRHEKRCFGFLGISSTSKTLNQVELKIAEFVMYYLSQMWKNVELLYDFRRVSEQMQALLEDFTALMEISRAIESGEDLQKLLEFIMDQCLQVIRAEAGSILLMTEDERELEFRVALGPKGKEIKPFRLRLGKGIAGWVAEHGKPLLVPDAYIDKRFDPSFDEKTGFKTKSILCVPLIHNNKILGVVQALNRRDGEEFNINDQQVFTIFATQAALAIENSRLLFREIEKKAIDRDIKVASEIQKLIIPHDLPQNYGLEMSGVHLPSQHIGGDFYSVFPVNKNELILCIADVSGKGVSGALLVSTLHASLKAYSKYTTDLCEIVTNLNRLIMEISTSDKFITLFIAKYDKKSPRLHYINAGHNPPLLFNRENGIRKLKSKGISIGIIEFDYEEQSIELKKDDLLVFFTDGVTETTDTDNKIFGEDKLIDLVKEHISDASTSLEYRIIKTLNDFRGSTTAKDDITLLVARKK